MQLVGELQLFEHPQGAEGAGADAVVGVEHGRQALVTWMDRKSLACAELLSTIGNSGQWPVASGQWLGTKAKAQRWS